MNCVILQPSYIPWRGYFHQIQRSDIFVFYDDVQYDKHGWRNRNRIKTPSGSQWITIPVLTKGYHSNKTTVDEIRICNDTAWNVKHWTAIKQYYGKAPFFQQYTHLLENFYGRQSDLLADFTIELTITLAQELGIKDTQFIRSSSLNAQGSKTDRLISILKTVGASHYISGPSAKEYLEEQKLIDASITLEYMTYNYPDYPQLYPPFDPQVTILDLLLMTGPQAANYIWK